MLTTYLLALVVGVILGAVLVPAIIYGLGPSLPMALRDGLGTLLWIVAAVTAERTVLVEREDGRYEPYVAGSENSALDQNGGAHEISTPEWSRLGLAPFGVGYSVCEEAFGDALYEYNDEPEPVALDIDNSEPATADGGVELLGDDRGGMTGFNAHADEPGYIVHLGKIINGYRGAGSDMARTAEEMALKKFGGDDNLGETLLIVSVIVVLVLGFATTWGALSL